ncbi:MAG TPA: catalase, partial [Thermoanaerobaculia bacterium]|nr:catalase [Thermoanaerobaculia bacterium]
MTKVPRKNNKSAAKSTVSSSSRGVADPTDDPAGRKARKTESLAAAFPANANKADEYGEATRTPKPGATAKPADREVTGSTLTETTTSAKTGTQAQPGFNPGNDPLDRVRVDSGGRVMTTNFGNPIADNQSSLKAGLRGPALLEDFILREKITHFDHERIPERIVHARGSAAHGYFECYKAMTKYTRASFLAAAGKRTPVFVRFSTVAGERGSIDTPRDVRGFATKFYTDEGNFDIVGNNIPIFFIQDAMKFPDLVHALKPEPHHGMPQAASAHDTFWDFVSLMPESTAMLMWVMSDRALPRSFSMMQGFGVHTFRLINKQGQATFVKFHWTPKAGTHSLDWDESVKIAGADADYTRRDLWESIESGVFPEYELGFQLFTEEQANRFSFDVLDPTKLVPEELVPVTPVGRMVLDRNPDNFFAETEQVAFGVQNLVPGVDFSNDPLLAGRIHSYFDTQLSRLGGPNFHEIPINSPIAQSHNNQRDGLHRQAIHRGRVAYEPSSLGGGCPYQAGTAGFTSFPEPIAADKMRGKPEKFADHYTQATLFWNSQTPYEKEHIIRGFRFELTKVQVPAIRQRTVSMLCNVADELAQRVADGLGIPLPEPMPRAAEAITPEVTRSPSLSLTARPGNGGIRGRKIAVLVAAGTDGRSVGNMVKKLGDAGAVVRLLGARLGSIEAKGGGLEADGTLETMPSVLFDAVVIPDGKGAAEALSNLGQAIEFLKDQYRHCKPILVLGAGETLASEAGI